jgi:hypothetical protein
MFEKKEYGPCVLEGLNMRLHEGEQNAGSKRVFGRRDVHKNDIQQNENSHNILANEIK